MHMYIFCTTFFTLRKSHIHCTLLNYNILYNIIDVTLIEARGQFTYWSQRTRARPVNKGLRLDYFVCSDDMFDVDTNTNTNSSSLLPLSTVVTSTLDSLNAVVNDEISTGIVIENQTSNGKNNNESTIEKTKSDDIKTKKRKTEDDFGECVDEKIVGDSSGSQVVRKAKVVDSYILHKETEGYSDHCPIVLIIQI